VSYVSIFFGVSLVLVFLLVLLINSSFFNRLRIKNKILLKIKRFLVTARQEVSNIKIRTVIILLGLSFVYWLIRNFMGYVIITSLGIPLDFITVIFINSVLILIAMIPIQTFAGFGLFEATFAYFLVQMGYQYEAIMPVLLMFHLIIFIVMIIYGAYGFLSLRFMRTKWKS
jgi:uncharacterized membrane protein YbhN (UPF0104 family)